MYFLSWIAALGIVGGLLGGKLMKGDSFGRSMDIVMGLGGAVGVGLTVGSLGVPGVWGFAYATAVTLLAATLLTALAAFVNGRKYA